MQIQIDLRAGTPSYQQIIHQIQHGISTGALLPGDQLPTVRQLADELRVNFNTVARAYRMLDEAGLISTQHGRGTYVLHKATEFQREQVLETIVSRFLEDAAQLGLTAEELQREIERHTRQGDND